VQYTFIPEERYFGLRVNPVEIEAVVYSDS
jgi:hypothetical protein